MPSRPLQQRDPAPALPAGDVAFLDRTVEAFQPYSPTPLTREDAREIVENVTGLLRVMARIEGRLAAERQQHDDAQREAS